MKFFLSTLTYWKKWSTVINSLWAIIYSHLIFFFFPNTTSDPECLYYFKKIQNKYELILMVECVLKENIIVRIFPNILFDETPWNSVETRLQYEKLSCPSEAGNYCHNFVSRMDVGV